MRHPVGLLLSLSLLLASLPAAAGNPSRLTILLNPPIVTGGLRSFATVTLPSPAPAEGTMVRLNASKVASPNGPAAAASVPPEILVPGGATTATFQIETTPVATAVTVSISASVGNSPTVVPLQVAPPSVARIRLNAGSVKGGLPVTGQIQLTGPAPVGGFNVNFASSAGAIAKVEPAMTVPAEQSAAAFTVQTAPVPAATDVIIAVSSPLLGTLVTKTAPLRVLP